jgi:peptidoglycan/LPS O-acetylase OafA/YrhL
VTEPIESTRPPGQRLPALTGIRAFAALWVVTYHYRGQIELMLPVARHADRLMQSGYLGVDLFFVLSGFILAYNYADRLGRRLSSHEYGRFLQLRLARIYPVHFFTLNVLVLMFAASRVSHLHINHPAARYDAVSYIWNLTLTQAWFTRSLSWNGPAWSISAEWFAYLLFPFAALLLVRWRSRLISLVGAALFYIVLIVSYRTFLNASPSALNGALLRVGMEFGAGCCLFKLFQETPMMPGAALVSVFTTIAVIAVPFLFHTGGELGYSMTPLFGLLVLSLAYTVGPVAWLLSRPWSLFWGEASYSLYMTHMVLQPVINRALPNDLAAQGVVVRAVELVVMLAALALAAAATYLVVERPARDRLRPKPRKAQEPEHYTPAAPIIG